MSSQKNKGAKTPKRSAGAVTLSKKANLAQAQAGQEPRQEAPTRKRSAAGRVPSLILLATDFSKPAAHALDEAVLLAKCFKAGVLLVHAVEPPLQPAELAFVPVESAELERQVTESSRERLEKIARKLADDGISARAMVKIGNAWQVIAAAAEKERADMIVIATRGYTGLKHLLIGSTAERVVRHAHCPVMVVR
jgi:universal stress protein A